VLDQQILIGWAVHESTIRDIRISCDDVVVAHAHMGFERPDVHRAFPGIDGSDRCGFRARLGSHLGEGSTRVTVEIEAGDGTLAGTTREIVRLSPGAGYAPVSFRAGIDRPVRSAFPFEVTELLRVVRPGTYDGGSCWGDDLMARAVEDLRTLWQGRTRAIVLNRYILFLKTMYHRFRWVRSRFLQVNEKAAHDAKDSAGMATSPAEMLAIANQLFVLKSNGLDGHFLEFGCFKGFSSSCLSFCCRHLDLPMEIFDSFAGLPPSDSDHYSAGEFCGTLAEVRANIDEFGDPRVVSFHEGFFADTLPRLGRRPVICIWMDVDLFSSARDVARIFDWLPRTSVVFTHEFPPDGAEGGRVIPGRSEVFPPILERFESLGRDPVGRYLDGALGAVWDAAEGIPVLPQHLLMELVNLGE
jgi:hypothetical protein